MKKIKELNVNYYYLREDGEIVGPAESFRSIKPIQTYSSSYLHRREE